MGGVGLLQVQLVGGPTGGDVERRVRAEGLRRLPRQGDVGPVRWVEAAAEDEQGPGVAWRPGC